LLRGWYKGWAAVLKLVILGENLLLGVSLKQTLEDEE